jgi:hypothetical protein
MASFSNLTLAGFVALHFGAVAVAWAARMAAGSRAEVLLQTVFFASMAGVGVCAWCCRGQELGLGIPSGLTLTAMVLTAVIDFRRTHETAPATRLSLHS